MRWKTVLTLGMLTAMIASGCREDSSAAAKATDQSGAKNQLTGRLTLTGSSTIAPLAAEIARRFEQQHPGVRIDVQSGGSGKGIADVRAGTADIGMASRALKAGEQDLEAYPIAADGVCLIVHARNEISQLDNDQVISVYTDRINNWKQLGGADLPITVVHKAEGRATLEVFLSYLGMENPAIHPDVIVGDNEHGIKTVAGAPGAVGYVSIGTAEANISAGVPIRMLPMQGVPATTENVATGRFPMSRPLNLVTSASPAPLSRAFIDYCQSEEVHDLIVAQYFVPTQR
ncbi:MAG: phosphate ABC transporter substrate-binding protein [Fuerstiella sp.]